MATIFAPPYFTALDAAGKPILNASLTFYRSGTLDLATVYADALGLLPLPNPVVTDAAGRAPTIYLADLSYRLIVRNTAGITIRDIDTIDGGPTLDVVQPNGSGEDDTQSLNRVGANNQPARFTAGTYVVNGDVDLGSGGMTFTQGAMFVVAPGATVTIRKQIVAGDYQIFSQTGDVLLYGDVNPIWFGATPGVETLAVAQANTKAFRLAACSYTAKWNKMQALAMPFRLVLPGGLFALANGFTSPTGVQVAGTGPIQTFFKRLSSYYDPVETAFPLLTQGMTLAPDLTMTGGSSIWVNSGAPYPYVAAHDLYFLDQNAAGAYWPAYPGAFFHDMGFLNSALAIKLEQCSDIVGNNIIIDGALVGISFKNSQVIMLTNLNMFNIAGQCFQFIDDVADVVVSNSIVQDHQGLCVNFQGGNTLPMKNIRLDLTVFQNLQYAGTTGVVNCNANNVEAVFSGSWRNIYGPVIVAGTVNTGCVFDFTGLKINGAKTRNGYNQGNTMSLGSVLSGTYRFTGCTFSNLFGSFITSGAAIENVTVSGGSFDNLTAPLFNLGPGTGMAEFNGITGDGSAPLFASSTNAGWLVSVRGCKGWLGPWFSDGAFNSWNVPISGGNTVRVSVTARTNTALDARLRKSAVYNVEKSIELNGGVVTDTLTPTLLSASPVVTGSGPVVAPSFTWSNNLGTQVVTGTMNIMKVRVPNTYDNVLINADFVG